MSHIVTRPRLIIPFIAVLLVLSVSMALSLTADEQELLSYIDGSQIRKTVFDLCSDRFAGRKAGSDGQALAAEYIAREFKRLGKDPVEGSYLQALTMRYALVKSVYDIKATLTYGEGNSVKQDVFAYPDFNGPGGIEVDAPVVFAGEGVVDPSSGRDDYSKIDAEGRIVVIAASSGANPAVSGRVLAAYQKGASAVLVVGLKNPVDQHYGGFGLAGAIADFPCLSIPTETARALFPGQWEKLTKRASGHATGKKVKISVPAIYNPDQPTQNVLARLVSDDGAGETLLVGAHYDHLGVYSTGKIFRGADDNASGAAVMLEVARAFAESGLTPKRDIVFAAWTGEECGLIGSNYFLKNPPFDLDKLKAVINLDMVGLGEPGKYKTAGRAACPDLFRTVNESAVDLNMRLLPDEVRAASDHLPFSRKGIPSILLHSAGDRPNYHSVRDCPELIDPLILENTAKMVALALWRLAEGP